MDAIRVVHKLPIQSSNKSSPSGLSSYHHRVLGFGFRWAQDEPFSFFGLFSVPAPFIIDHELSSTLGDLHDTVAWAIIILSGLHACIALGHHYLLKDSTLRRMLPAGRKNLQG